VTEPCPTESFVEVCLQAPELLHVLGGAHVVDGVLDYQKMVSFFCDAREACLERARQDALERLSFVEFLIRRCELVLLSLPAISDGAPVLGYYAFVEPCFVVVETAVSESLVEFDHDA
jgi:hypothetical protein